MTFLRLREGLCTMAYLLIADAENDVSDVVSMCHHLVCFSGTRESIRERERERERRMDRTTDLQTDILTKMKTRNTVRQIQTQTDRDNTKPDSGRQPGTGKPTNFDSVTDTQTQTQPHRRVSKTATEAEKTGKVSHSSVFNAQPTGTFTSRRCDGGRWGRVRRCCWL